MKPNPGSADARALGCLCPMVDNRRGLGAYEDQNGKPVFWLSQECPMHGSQLMPKDPITKDLFEVENG